MIVVRVELHSAITGKVTELARMVIYNLGDHPASPRRGNYGVTTFRGRTKEDLDKKISSRKGVIDNYPRLSLHVWHLVERALQSVGYVR